MHTALFLFGANLLRARAGGFAADVDDVRAGVEHPQAGAMAVSGVRCVPPSLKESGVTFRIPMTSVRSVGRSSNLAAGRGLRRMGSGLVAGPVPGAAARESIVDSLPSEYEAHGLGAGGRVMELTAHRTGDGLCAGLADTAHGHAHVFAFDDDDRAARVQVRYQRLNDLGGEALLHLRPAWRRCPPAAPACSARSPCRHVTGCSRHAPLRGTAPGGARTWSRRGCP